jgi:hypothetical protein
LWTSFINTFKDYKLKEREGQESSIQDITKKGHPVRSSSVLTALAAKAMEGNTPPPENQMRVSTSPSPSPEAYVLPEVYSKEEEALPVSTTILQNQAIPRNHGLCLRCEYLVDSGLETQHHAYCLY